MRPLGFAALLLICVLVMAGCAPASTPAPTPAPPMLTPAPPAPTPAPPTAASLTQAPSAPPADPVAAAKAWVDAINTGDVGAALALLGDDATWIDRIFSGDATGKMLVRDRFDEMVALETKLQVKDCQTRGDQIVCTVSNANSCTAAYGLSDGLTEELAFTYLPDGKLRQASLTSDDPKLQDVNKSHAALSVWALENRAEEWAKAGQLTGAGGSIMSKLCKEYAASLGGGDKIQNAMSAAPKSIAQDATIVDWPAQPGSDPAVLRKGTNGWTCYPDWSASPGNDPECNDSVMEAWFRALLAGQKEPPPIIGPGIAYMLVGGSDPSNTDPMAAAPAPGEDWITSPSHVMLIVPGGFDAKQFSTDPKSGEPYIMWDGTPYEHLMVPVVPLSLEEMGNADATMQNAMSAAPAAVAAQAAIVGWPEKAGDPMVVLRKGTNEWTCLADWPASPGNDPACNDPMWTVWNDALAAGTAPKITAPGIAYMLVGGSDPSNTDPMAIEPAPGEDWVNSGPHIMLLIPGGFDAKQFSTDPKSGEPYIMWDGTPYEHVMLPVADVPG